jgi:hypothetical protein
MDMGQVTISDMMVTGNFAQVKVTVLYQLKQDVYGSSFVAESCARGHYGEPNQLFPAGTTWRLRDGTINMQRWASGWKC